MLVFKQLFTFLKCAGPFQYDFFSIFFTIANMHHMVAIVNVSLANDVDNFQLWNRVKPKMCQTLSLGWKNSYCSPMLVSGNSTDVEGSVHKTSFSELSY